MSLWLLRTADIKIIPFKDWYSGMNTPGKDKNLDMSCQGSRQYVQNKAKMHAYFLYFLLSLQF